MNWESVYQQIKVYLITKAIELHGMGITPTINNHTGKLRKGFGHSMFVVNPKQHKVALHYNVGRLTHSVNCNIDAVLKTWCNPKYAVAQNAQAVRTFVTGETSATFAMCKHAFTQEFARKFNEVEECT